MKVNAQRLQLIALIIIGAMLFLCKLWQGDMRGDCLFYSEVAKEILKTGDWITMHHGYRPYFNKPPLLFWLTAINYKIFGINNFAARLWSPLFALLSGIVFFFLAKRFFSEKVAFLSALVLYLTKDFVKDNMGLHLDSAIVFSIVAFIFFFTLNEWKFAVLAGISFGIGLLGKGIQACYGPLIVVALLLFTQPKKTIDPKLWVSIMIGIGCFIIWFIPQVVLHNREFLDVFVFKQTLGRVTGAFSYSKGKVYYLKVLLENYWPWLILLPFGLWRIWKRGRGEQRVLVFSWIGVVAFSLCFPEPEYGRYLLPIYPAFALAIGFFLADLIKEHLFQKLVKFVLSIGIVGFFLLNIFPIQLHENAYGKLRELKPFVDYLLKKERTQLQLLSPHYRTYTAVLFYFDIVPVVVAKDNVKEGILIVERKKENLIPDYCNELFSNSQYILAKCRTN